MDLTCESCFLRVQINLPSCRKHHPHPHPTPTTVEPEVWNPLRSLSGWCAATWDFFKTILAIIYKLFLEFVCLALG